MNISQEDVHQIESRGLTTTKISNQIALLQRGHRFVNLHQPCTPGDGIHIFEKDQVLAYIEAFKKHSETLNVEVMIPASGAASRMFKHLFEPESNVELVKAFFKNIEKFPFSKKIEGLSKDETLKKLLSPVELNYQNTPKGLIPFHTYGASSHTAFEDQIREAALYATVGGKVKMNFTVSPAHSEKFKNTLDDIRDAISVEFNVALDITFTHQSTATDTVALTEQNDLLRDDEGNLVFRPGGHGALLSNLGAMEGDLIFVKNIDNINKDHQLSSDYKMFLGGLAFELKQAVDAHIAQLKDNKGHQEAKAFIEKWMVRGTLDEGVDLLEWLDRPLRVCGMVKNTGEPGGGPFWCDALHPSPQIVEKSQIDTSAEDQNNLLKSATHFNPVDIVCCKNDVDGKGYSLRDYVDFEGAFVSSKSHQGQAIKVLEHPGLWNGAMAKWNTVFVDVPLETFAPVKTVNDLLNGQHQ